jgi:SAM-dependent methyltransferase
MEGARYDEIGRGYERLRRPDPRIAARVEAALGEARTVLNVGAGTGSYEPADREVTAVEPSAEMIAQRPADAAPVVRASAEALPFDDDSFDAAMAILTVHHWADQARGIAELRRVARGPIVVLTIDTRRLHEVWITRDYFPEAIARDEERFPPIEALVEMLGGGAVETVPVPRDCTDAFGVSLWGRPEAVLDPELRQVSSNWHEGSAEATERGLRRLAADLESGAWDERHGHLRSATEFDVGLRLVVANGAGAPA